MIGLLVVCAIVGLLIWIGVSANRISWSTATPDQRDQRLTKRRNNRAALLFCAGLLAICWLASMIL